MKLYIAARNQEKAAELRRALISDGHVITSRWITDDKKFCYGVGAYSDEERIALARMDEADVRQATDGMILIADPEGVHVPGGKHVETGIAIALGRRVFVLGRRENVFHWHPLVTVCQDEEALRQQLVPAQEPAVTKQL